MIYVCPNCDRGVNPLLGLNDKWQCPSCLRRFDEPKPPPPERADEIASIRSKLTAAEAERDDFMEQAALKRDCHKDMQALMVRNNELLARAEAAEAREAQLLEALAQEEEYLHGTMDSDADIMHGDIEGAFRRLQTALSNGERDET